MNALGLEILGGIQNFLSVVDILLLFRFCYTVGERYKYKHYVLAGVIFVVYAIVVGIFLDSGRIAFASIYIYLAVVGIVFKAKRKWTAIFMMIPTMLIYYLWSNLCELMCCFITWNKFNSKISNSIFFGIGEDLILAVLLLWLISRKEKEYPTMSLNVGESVLISLFCVFSMTFTIIFEILDEQLMNGMYTIAWMIFVIVLNIIVPYGIIHRCQARYYRTLSNNYKEQFEMEYYFFRNYKEQQKDEARFRHDWKNHMLLLQSMFEKGEYEKAKEYFAQLTDKKKQSGNIILTGNEIVDMILSAKQEKIQKFGIQINCEGGLEHLEFMEAMDCCVLFSNLIDNAIEANNQCDSSRFIKISSVENAGTFMISMENKMCGELQQEEERLLTTKMDKKKHGWGTINAFEVIKKYNGEYQITAENGVFCIRILLPYKNVC